MSKTLLTGSFVALITPFNKDGSVDFAAFRTLLKFHEDHGTSAVLIMGSTGETSMLSPEEKKAIIVECAKMKSARMPLFFGCTGNNTEATIASVRFAKDNGADGAILAAPAYICAPENDIERYSLCDPEGRITKSYLRQARRHVSKDGLIIFSICNNSAYEVMDAIDLNYEVVGFELAYSGFWRAIVGARN